MTPTDTIASTVICPLCELISPTGTSKCDCGYDFVNRQPHLKEAKAFALSYAQRLRVGWFFMWRCFVLTLVSLLGGMLLGWFMKYRLSLNMLTRVVILLAIAPFFLWVLLWVYKIFFLNTMLKKKFRKFRIVLWRAAESQESSQFSLKDTVTLTWLHTWRVGLLGGIVGAAVGLIQGPSLYNNASMVQDLKWFGYLQSLFIGWPWAIHAMLKKEFRGFRLRAVRTAPVDTHARSAQS